MTSALLNVGPAGVDTGIVDGEVVGSAGVAACAAPARELVGACNQRLVTLGAPAA